MENDEEIRKEDKRAIKEVLTKLVDEEPAEISQEDAIRSYKSKNTKKYNPNGNNSDEDSETSNQEEEEHLKRVKQELLSSLKRVEDLANKIFVAKEGRKKNIAKELESKEASKTTSKEQKLDNEKQKESDDERTL